jgi:hypothetical protein
MPLSPASEHSKETYGTSFVVIFLVILFSAAPLVTRTQPEYMPQSSPSLPAPLLTHPILTDLVYKLGFALGPKMSALLKDPKEP